MSINKNKTWTTIEVDWDADSLDGLLELPPKRFQLPSDIDINDEDDAERVLDWLTTGFGWDVAGMELVEGEASEQISFETTAIYVLDDGETYSCEEPACVYVTDRQLERIDAGESVYNVVPSLSW